MNIETSSKELKKRTIDFFHFWVGGCEDSRKFASFGYLKIKKRNH